MKVAWSKEATNGGLFQGWKGMAQRQVLGSNQGETQRQRAGCTECWASSSGTRESTGCSYIGGNTRRVAS